MVLKNSLPSGRHREVPKLNHFDKLSFSSSKGSHRETPKIVGWMIFFCPPRGRARKVGFYALFSKIFCFWLRSGAIFIRVSDSRLRNGAIFEPVFFLIWFGGAILEPNPIHGIKIDAGFGSRFFAVASKLMPFWLPPHLFPVGSAI